MRKLTIKRKRCAVGFLGKVKIYIEDPSAGKLWINATACRKLGDIKNGEEKTFEIGEQAARIYVIGDIRSKDTFNEFYELPEGKEDIFLSGKNYFSPFSGNPFRFDNNESDAALYNRKRVKEQGRQRGLAILIPVIIGAAVMALLGGLFR